MTFLEIGEAKSLAQRFNFLNLSNSSADLPGDEEVSCITPVEPLKFTQSSYGTPKAFPAQSKAQYFNEDELAQLCVVKSTINGEKLFINLLQPVIAASEVPELILFSDVSTDIDKAGQLCYVITSLIFSPFLSTQRDEKITEMLAVLRESLAVDIGDRYTIPKLKRKGTLGKIQRPFAPLSAQNTKHSHTVREVHKRLITELDEPEPRPNQPGASGRREESGHRHKISRHSISVLASPLPTIYTHHLSMSLASDTSATKLSWSIYYDAQDSSLKVLVPPKEEFETIAVGTDDFRAFTKDQRLHIFYIGT